MVTRQQAEDNTEFHVNGCSFLPNPRNKTGKGKPIINRVVFRKNGKVQTWKRQPERFKVPIKYGLKDYGYITNENAHFFHIPAECPLNK